MHIFFSVLLNTSNYTDTSEVDKSPHLSIKTSRFINIQKASMSSITFSFFFFTLKMIYPLLFFSLQGSKCTSGHIIALKPIRWSGSLSRLAPGESVGVLFVEMEGSCGSMDTETSFSKPKIVGVCFLPALSVFIGSLHQKEKYIVEHFVWTVTT